jgi:hypothetical protein
MLAGADTPDPTACHGCSPVRATETSLAPIRDSELPSGLYQNNGKPTIDRNFFKSMAKTIKVNLGRVSKADVDVVDEEACTHYTGSYTSNSCGGKTAYVNWIEGDALRMRVELKFRLLREKMLALASEASNNRSLRILEKNTVDFRDQEFQEKMRHIKIIELKAELEAKRALLEALIREKQQVSLPRRACIPEELHPGQL